MPDPDSYERLAFDLDSTTGVMVMRFARPDAHNAVDDRMHSELSRVFAEVSADSDIRALVLTGDGSTFSVGGDTDPDRAYESESGVTPIEEARRIVTGIIEMATPFVCAVNGHAIGLGATIASLADASFAVRGARFGDPHVLAALPAGNGSAVIWPLLIGVNRAKRLLMTGDLVSTDDAAALGLVTDLVDDGDALTAAMDYARRLAVLAPQAVRGTKTAVNGWLRAVFDGVLDTGLALEEAAMEHPDFATALRSLTTEREA